MRRWGIYGDRRILWLDLWRLGLVLALANVLGGVLGAHMAIRGGSPLVRRIFLLVAVLLILKVGMDTVMQ